MRGIARGLEARGSSGHNRYEARDADFAGLFHKPVPLGALGSTWQRVIKNLEDLAAFSCAKITPSIRSEVIAPIGLDGKIFTVEKIDDVPGLFSEDNAGVRQARNR